jgi:hypothetical protein
MRKYGGYWFTELSTTPHSPPGQSLGRNSGLTGKVLAVDLLYRANDGAGYQDTCRAPATLSVNTSFPTPGSAEEPLLFQRPGKPRSQRQAKRESTPSRSFQG